jgi:hypothetical protein
MRRDGTIPKIRLFSLELRVGTGLSQCCPQLSLKIGGTREEDTKDILVKRARIWNYKESICITHKVSVQFFAKFLYSFLLDDANYQQNKGQHKTSASCEHDMIINKAKQLYQV